MASHSPTPWRVEWREPDCAVWDADDEHVASVYGDGSVENADANAHLIAAAPDLLAALKEYHKANRLHHDEDARLYDISEAAIQKAEGVTHAQ